MEKKHLTKFSTFHDKTTTTTTLNQLGIKGSYFNTIKAMYEKLTATCIFDGEKLKVFPVGSGTRQGCPLSPFVLKTVLEILEQSGKKNKSHSDRKRRRKIISVHR